MKNDMPTRNDADATTSSGSEWRASKKPGNPPLRTFKLECNSLNNDFGTRPSILVERFCQNFAIISFVIWSKGWNLKQNDKWILKSSKSLYRLYSKFKTETKPKQKQGISYNQWRIQEFFSYGSMCKMFSIFLRRKNLTSIVNEDAFWTGRINISYQQ